MKIFNLGMILALWAPSASLLLGCHAQKVPPPLEVESIVTQTAECPPSPPPYQPTPEQDEKDHIYSLLAYSVVYKNWQVASVGPGVRGYNIGSVLVNPSGQVVCWARNSVGITGNKTQHGEVRLMTNYLHNTLQGALKGYTVYTTLEPCAMCSGMMTLINVQSTVYGQSDPDFGKALDRLEFNSTSINGFCPYPRGVTSGQEHSPIARQLDEAYTQYRQAHDHQGITQFLAAPEAKQIFADAEQQLLAFKVQFPANQSALDSARSFLQSVPAQYTEMPYTTSCPGP
jgi:tRNA(Arg) A34 adenosine deaminase TadA